MSIFRKFINVGFWVCFVVCLIGVLIGSIAGSCIRNMEWLGLVILVGGGFAVTMMFAMFGMFIELCNNVADIKKRLYQPMQYQTVANSANGAAQSMQVHYMPVQSDPKPPSIDDALEKYRELMEQGIITEEEFQTKAQQLMELK